MSRHALPPLPCLSGPLLRPALTGFVALVLAASAWADKSDRSKPLTMESDKPCTVDLAKQLSVCSGNVVIAQGTLQIRAERIELRETPDGYRTATAIGTAGKPASYRQRREGAQSEQVEGLADRIEYDGRADAIRFVGNASVRRLRAGVVADEIQGSQIVWDNTAELFSVQGGNASAAGGGRVRAVLAPRDGNSPAAAAPAAPSPSTPVLRPSSQIGERR
ncbi:lipopolysaccharide transport periplasmic protein LptA [Burkholderiales bacterium JOSHI_001]|nr:lipopolysaccharide transport periplasmic protein LptA [Burkholderiales bacterium JOSHI_001]